MSQNIKKITEIVTPIIERLGLFLVEVAIRGERNSKVVEVFADGDNGITIEQCSVISRELSAILETENIIQGRYRLDVSSPGLDKPLKLHRQYKKNLGRLCKIKFQQENEKPILTGTLFSVTETEISIRDEKKREYTITINKIIEAYILPRI